MSHENISFTGLSVRDYEILHRICTYFQTNISLYEKLRVARLLATLDLEYDPVLANQGDFSAQDIIRVTNLVLAQDSLNFKLQNLNG